MLRSLSAGTNGLIAAWFATLLLLGGCDSQQPGLTEIGDSTTEGPIETLDPEETTETIEPMQMTPPTEPMESIALADQPAGEVGDLAELLESLAGQLPEPASDSLAAGLEVEIVETDAGAAPAVGARFTVEAQIVNFGGDSVEGIRVRLRCDDKLEADAAEFSLTDLAAGASRHVVFDVLAKAAGSSQYTVEVTREGGRLAGGSGQLTVVEPGEAPQPEESDDNPPSEEPARPRGPKTAEELGPPLDYKADKLEKLMAKYPVWVTTDRKSVVMVGQVCQRKYPLELFACLRGSKEHESVLVFETAAYVVHTALLVVGAESGAPVEFYPDYKPASGTEIEIEVLWATEDGKIHRARAQDWVRDVQTHKAMEHAWVFAGSRFLKDERTGERAYWADREGDLICVSNFPSAVLDLPIRSSDAASGLLFEAFTENIPPLTTAVTLVMTPKK